MFHKFFRVLTRERMGEGDAQGAANLRRQNTSTSRVIATRYEKTAENFAAAVHLAAATIWLG